MQILAPELNDRLLADFLDMESSLIVSMHIQSVDQVKAIKTVKRKITDLDRSKIEEQKKQFVPDTTWTSFHLTLLLTAVKRKTLAGFAEPQRENVPFDLSGAEHSGQSPSAWQQHFPGRLHCPEV